MKNGWIKLHRSLKEWGWSTDPITLHVFIHFLLDANIKESHFLGHKIYPGQLAISVLNYSKSIGVSRQSLRTAINHLKSTNELTIKTNKKFTVISIKNWDRYQDANQPANHLLTNSQPTANHIIRNKEEKEKKENKEKSYFASNEAVISSFFGVLNEESEKVQSYAKKYDIRPKDVIYMVNTMVAKESLKEHTIGDIDAMLAVYVANGLRWKSIKTLSDKSEQNAPKPAKPTEEDMWIAGLIKDMKIREQRALEKQTKEKNEKKPAN